MRLFRSRLPCHFYRTLPAAFAKTPPAGPDWIHEIKHDGFRIIARRDGKKVRLVTRNGYDFADRFPLIVEAIAALPVHSCVVDGEAIAVDETGLSVFGLIRYRGGPCATLCAFDLVEIDGEDLPATDRSAQGHPQGPITSTHAGIAFNEIRGRRPEPLPSCLHARL